MLRGDLFRQGRDRQVCACPDPPEPQAGTPFGCLPAGRRDNLGSVQQGVSFWSRLPKDDRSALPSRPGRRGPGGRAGCSRHPNETIMNEQERIELERLKTQQARLESELGLLGRQLRSLEQQVRQNAQAWVPIPQPPEPLPQSMVPPAAPSAPLSPGVPPLISACYNAGFREENREL